MNSRMSPINDPDEENLDKTILRNENHVFSNENRGGEFSTGTMGKFHPALTRTHAQMDQSILDPVARSVFFCEGVL